MIQIKHKAWVEGTLRELEFIQWDRYYSYGQDLAFYGWIGREDQYKDFAVLVLDNQNKQIVGYHCSSPEYSEEIGNRLNLGHSECRRVEDKLCIDNMVELETGDDTQ